MNSGVNLREEIKFPGKLDYNEFLKNCLINYISGIYLKKV